VESLPSARDVGHCLADCKDVRSEEASDAAWELYVAARDAGVVGRFNIRDHNFALGAVSQGVDGPSRVTSIWDAITRAAVPPNGVTMALLARGLCRSSADVASTLAVLREGIVRGAAVDAYVLNVLLNSCLRDVSRRGKEAIEDESNVTAVDLGKIKEAALLVWDAGKDMHNERTLTSVVKVLGDCGDHASAVRTFDEAWAKGTPVDVDCLATALRVMSSARAELYTSRDVLALYRRAQKERGIRPNTFCANVVLAACSRDGNWNSALSLWRHMLRRSAPAPDKASLASVILACGRVGRGELALRAFEEGKSAGVECDVVIVNVLLDACAKSDRPPGEALDILMDAIESRIAVDACTISSLLTAYCSGSSVAEPGMLDQAFAIVELGRFLRVEPTPAVINSLLRACVAAGDLPRAVRAFEEAAVVGAGPDDIAVADSSSVSVLVEGYAATGDVAAAASMLDLGRDLGIEIAESTVVLLIKSLVNAGDVEAATRAYDDAVKTHEMTPTLPMINALLAGLARSGSWREAIRLVSDDVIGSASVAADNKLIALFTEAFEVGGEEEQAKVAAQRGLWLTGSDDALVAHLIAEDERVGERV
jgi:pentatricopeptide repeat protein